MDLSESRVCGHQRLAPDSAAGGDDDGSSSSIMENMTQEHTNPGRRGRRIVGRRCPRKDRCTISEASIRAKRKSRKCSMPVLTCTTLLTLLLMSLARAQQQQQQQQPLQHQFGGLQSPWAPSQLQSAPRQPELVAQNSHRVRVDAEVAQQQQQQQHQQQQQQQQQQHQQQQQQANSNGPPTGATDSFGSRLAAASELFPASFSPSDDESRQFLSRQGQLAPAATVRQPQTSRQQPPRPQPQQMIRPKRPQQQQLQSAPSNQVELAAPFDKQQPLQAPRFQRMRPADPVSGGLPNPNPNPNPNRPQQQQPASQANPFAPTLSAFDLSSLANLANQQVNQFGPMAPRRPQPPLQSLRNNQQPVTTAGAQTELPFIRQVFRPASEGVLSNENEDSTRGGRPTPPPLFVPARPQQPKLQRPLESSGGFTPLQMPARNEVFFGPSQPLAGGLQMSQQRPRPVLPAVQVPQLMNQSTGNQLADGSRRRQPQPQAPSQQQQQPPPRPPSRPSQRPQLPNVQVPVLRQAQVAPTNRQVATQPVTEQPTTDVIRLASSAIQAANEGLAAISAALATQPPPSSTSQPDPSTGTGSSSATSSESGDTTRTTASMAGGSTAAITTTTSSSVAQFNQASSPESSSPLTSFGENSQQSTTTTAATTTTTNRRALSPIRSSANFFTAAANSATSASPSAFSPSLPINAAVAATGGRRRIPVRQGSSSSPTSASVALSSGRQTLSPTTQLPPFVPTTLRNQQAPITTMTTTSTTSSPTTIGSVRRPEIEEFYETISGNGSSTTIDGFGAPVGASSQKSQQQSTSTPPAPLTSGDQQDLYGSRLTSSTSSADSSTQTASSIAASSEDSPAKQPDTANVPKSKQETGLAPPVLVPVTYVTTLTYLTTVLHGTHTLETSHESVATSTELATLNAQLMDQIEHRLPLIEPTQTVALSSRVKGKGTTMVNLKSQVSAFNQELVDALQGAAPPAVQVQPTQVVGILPTVSVGQQQKKMGRPQRPLVRATRTIDVQDLAEAKKSLVTEYLYLYTVRPMADVAGNQPAKPLPSTTSLRSELVAGTVSGPELMSQLASLAAASAPDTSGQQPAQLIDSRGFLRLAGQQQQESALNLGSTVGRDQNMVTEVNMQAASYIKFDDISNVMVELRPSLLRPLTNPEEPLEKSGNHRNQLDGSFALDLSLGGALDKLVSAPSGAQQTPSLDSVLPATARVQRPSLEEQPTTKTSSQPLASSSMAAGGRSQLRSRVASSRFRSPQLQSPAPAVSAPLAANSTSTVAPPGGLSQRQQRPIKSRIVRPPTVKPSASINGHQSGNGPEEAVTSAPTTSSLATTVRSSKPRFVVVTRTGQFGIRASAMSSMASVLNESGPQVSPTSVQSEQPATSATVRVSSRFSKPNRFRASKTLVVAPTSVDSTQQVVGSTQPSVDKSLVTLPPLTTSSETTATSQQEQAETSAEQALAKVAASGNRQQQVNSSPPGDAIQVEGSGSVVVTYFTTTTHTIPFTINSETIFTTIEETNSRVATEFVRDLGSHFIEPTPTASLPTLATLTSASLPTTTAATTTTTTKPAETTKNEQTTIASSGEEKLPSTITITTQETSQSGSSPPPPPPPSSPAPLPVLGESGSANNDPEPSFVVSLNTRTYLTTFTYFTTYSATDTSPTVKSSESTTSSLQVELMTSLVEPSKTIDPGSVPIQTSLPPAPPSLSTLFETLDSSVGSEQTSVATSTTNQVTQEPQPSTVAPTFESTSFIDSSTSLTSNTPTQVLQQVIQTVSLPAQISQEIQQSSTTELNLNQVNKITRTRSLYTTLTHYITFYSGTKTQLSTIQEISPTVVTEYIDRTSFEEEQRSMSSIQARESSQVLVIPSASSDFRPPPISITPTPVMPAQTSVQTSSMQDGNSQEESTSASTSDQTRSLEGAESVPSGANNSQSTTEPGTTTTISNGDNQPEQSGNKGEVKATNIIELSDLIASNSSQSGRVALAGNLGAAIKDIVQLLAGNKTNTMSPLDSNPTDATSSSTSTTTTSALSSTPATTSTSTPTSSASSRRPAPTGGRLFGQKAREQQQMMLNNLQGSISSPVVPLGSSQSTLQETPTRTPELSSTLVAQQQQAAATIFFGDDGGDERRKQIRTVWPGSSTVLVTSVEPSTRSLLLTTTKVYYTRDSPITITSSFTSLIAPRTFVSTIMGTRTLVSQLGATISSSKVQSQASAQSTAAQVLASRQEGQAAGHRLAQQQKQQQAEQKLQRQQLQKVQKALVANSAKPADLANMGPTSAAPISNNNSNQCQPACKASQNEVCKMVQQNQFACACRPGHHLALIRSGQRQCLEVQSYVVLLRLLQVGEQQVSFGKEFQNRTSQEYRHYARLIGDHVRRAYLGAELTRDRFVGADVVGFARSLSLSQSPSAISSASPRPIGGRQPLAVNSSSFDPLNSGIIVNITVHLQPSSSQHSANIAGGEASEPISELALKEELTKRLNLRQAAALAAAAASSSSSSVPSSSGELATASNSSSDELLDQTNNATSAAPDETLPNPNALFLADVEQVTDLDECAHPALNDCHEGAICINEPGSYRCDCRQYPDLNPLQPGRQCANELKSCDHCNNRGDCLRVPSLVPSTFNSSQTSPVHHQRTGQFSTVCQCHRFYLGRRCEINGFLLACLLPILAILLFISICLVIYCCRRWRKRSALSKGFRNIGTFGPNMIGGTLDRKAMLESSSESSDTHQRSHHLRNGGNAAIYDTSGGIPSDPPTSSSNESSPRQMARNQMANQMAAADQLGYNQQSPPGPFCSSIPPQIVIPRARHNQVNYAVHRGQVYMW